MEELSEIISGLVDEKQELFTYVSDRIWEYAETRFEEEQSADLLTKVLTREGFTVKRGVAGLDTGFIASFGSEGPVIAILGEYDALSGLSQQAGLSAFAPVVPNGNGHGCGHNLLGSASLAAAVAVKDYLRQHEIPGTIRYYGCPAEESGSGKTYMTREGVFADVDVALTWHPASFNSVPHMSSNGNIHATFRFKGRSAHAAAAPHLGRSALDAVELMNVGVNYLREHMISDARIHYAVTNTGGLAPNVVQSEAEVTYLVRAPKTQQVRELFARVLKIAEGAALMTETTMEWYQEGGCANLIPNTPLERVMHKYMADLGAPAATEEEIQFAQAIYASLAPEEKAMAAAQVGKAIAAQFAERPIPAFVMPYSENLMTMPASTDVADVSWVVPTAQCVTATWAYGTVPHTWQVVAQGQSSYAQKAMLYAGKIIACAAIEALQNAELREQAKAELLAQLDGETYDCLIPADVQPPTLAELQSGARKLVRV